MTLNLIPSSTFQTSTELFVNTGTKFVIASYMCLVQSNENVDLNLLKAVNDFDEVFI